MLILKLNKIIANNNFLIYNCRYF